MPAFKTQMRMKFKLSFAEWANQLESLGMLKSLKLGRWSMPLEEFANWSVVLYWKILSGKQIQSCNNAFLFNKWTYKSHF